MTSSGYKIMSLEDMLNQLGEDKVKDILSSFSCPLNKDIEDFIHNKAIPFSMQSLCQTHLVFTSHKKKMCLVGFFALSQKYLKLSQSSLSKTLKKKIARFARRDPHLNEYIISLPLIGQLSKNFTDNLNTLITGDELLKMAFDKIHILHQIVSGKTAYLECEDKECLIKFYSDNGFVKFAERTLDKDEEDKLSGKYLVQMIKVFK